MPTLIAHRNYSRQVACFLLTTHDVICYCLASNTKGKNDQMGTRAQCKRQSYGEGDERAAQAVEAERAACEHIARKEAKETGSEEALEVANSIQARRPKMLCAYGNCTEDVSPKARFTLTTCTYSANGTVSDRNMFCCYEHAWRFLKRRDERLNGPRDQALAAQQ